MGLFNLGHMQYFYKLVYLLLSLFCIRNVKVFLKGKNVCILLFRNTVLLLLVVHSRHE